MKIVKSKRGKRYFVGSETEKQQIKAFIWRLEDAIDDIKAEERYLRGIEKMSKTRKEQEEWKRIAKSISK